MSRRAEISVLYKGTNLDSRIQKYIKTFAYTDVASGESDNISIQLSNIDKKWINGWMPCRGDKLTPTIKVVDWEKENTSKTNKPGQFIIDDMTFSGRELSGTIKAVSKPVDTDFSETKRNKTWESVTIKEIAQEIASRAGIELYYEAPIIQIDEIEQTSNTDSNFLYTICQDYGLAMKVYNNKLVIFDEETYEAKKPVTTVNEKDMLTWSYNTTTAGTYTGAKISYTDEETDETITVQVGKDTRLYEVSRKVYSQRDAELKAAAAVNNANKKIVTMTIKIKAKLSIYASSVIKVTGLYKLNGLYYVDEVKHAIGSSGYTMSLTLHLIQERIKAKSVLTAEVESDDGSTKYTVKSGDTLWMLANTYYGSGSKYTIIYNTNKEVIEAAAQAHGYSNSENGHWIFPGTLLIIP